MVWHTRWPRHFLSAFILGIFFCGVSFAETQAPAFSKKKIAINKNILEVEIAETQEQHSYGLMNRNKLADNTGMLFVFPTAQIRSFWMKDTFIDLSIGYFDHNKVLFQITDMKATSLMEKSHPSYPSHGPAQFALEVPKGWFTKHNVKIGDKFEWR